MPSRQSNRLRLATTTWSSPTAHVRSERGKAGGPTTAPAPLPSCPPPRRPLGTSWRRVSSGRTNAEQTISWRNSIGVCARARGGPARRLTGASRVASIELFFQLYGCGEMLLARSAPRRSPCPSTHPPPTGEGIWSPDRATGGGPAIGCGGWPWVWRQWRKRWPAVVLVPSALEGAGLRPRLWGGWPARRPEPVARGEFQPGSSAGSRAG